jgi:hypothetical protein
MDAATAITVAAIGLLGVLIGGVITAGANFVLAVRRERVDARRDDRSHAIEVRRASRLIVFELLGAAATVKSCVEKRQWWVTPHIQLKTEAWQKYSDVIAPALSETEWFAVSKAFMEIEQILADPDKGEEITDIIAEEWFAPRLQDIQKAVSALGPYARDFTRKGLWLRWR